MDVAKLQGALERARLRRDLPDREMRRYLRERAGLTQWDVAKILGVNRVTVTRWESGARTPRGQILVDYSRLLQRLAEEALT